jgi:Cu+-exporting ATPase
MTEEAQARMAAPAVFAARARQAERRAGKAERAACFHCGQPCGDPCPVKEDKVFCCPGCLLVHDLLAENKLEHYYDLGRHPGVRPGQRDAGRDRWWCLDEPSVGKQLLDFTDGNISRLTLRIPAIHCVACVWLLENLFRLHPAIGASEVNFLKREVTITFSTGKIALSELAGLLASMGYAPQLTLGELERGPKKADPGRRRQWLQVGIAGFAFGNIMLFTLPVYFGLDSLSGPLFKRLFGYLSLALAAPVLFYSASDYWRSARLSLRQRVLTLDVPIVLGLAALYARSALEIVSGSGDGYLDSLSGLVFFLLCGRVFQHKTQERMAFDRDYKSFFPLSVARKTAVGEENVVLSGVQTGDRLLLRNGDLIPADARLISPQAIVDYSFVTGESEPVAREAGAYLYAGGRQIGGAIEVETLKPVSQGYLASLWNQEAFRKKRGEDLNTLTNRYSRRFTRLVLAVAAGAGLAWLAAGHAAQGLKAFTSVLIVACPCALALAAPFTLGTAQRLLARRQVFLKNVLVLERMAEVDAIVFDKTGTLTAAGTARFFNAQPACLSAGEGGSTGGGPGPVTKSVEPSRAGQFGVRWQARRDTALARPASGVPGPPASPLRSAGALQETTLSAALDGGLSEEEAGWVYSLARHSRHPHSVRIGESVAGRGRVEPVSGFAETPGGGLAGRVPGHPLRLGSRAWLESSGVAVPESRLPAGSAVFLAIDGECRGVFVLGNTFRPEAEGLLRRLDGHYELALLSGDNSRERGRFLAFFGGQAQMHFDQSPLDKLRFIRSLQERGKTVMMVGDGLNDAGALQQSDVGVAVVEKVGAFSPASDVILEAGQVPRLSEILHLARRATRIVRWGFGISALYNALGVSIAAMGVLSPVICAILMPLSSISVVLFACTATRWAAAPWAATGEGMDV